MTQLRGTVALSAVQGFITGDPIFPDVEYRQTTRATFEELSTRPNAVADRLVGRFVRGLGIRHRREMADLLD